jgi:hypothetical protein
MASPATALSQAGQPAATCSPSTYLLKFPNLKLKDDSFPLELALPDSPNSLPPLSPPAIATSSAACFFFPPFSLSLDPSRLRLKLPDPTPLSLNAPEWSSAGVTDTACLELTQPIPAHYHHHHHPMGTKIGTGHGSTRKIRSNFLDPS